MLLILLRCYEVLFAAVGQPKYEGPSKITELNPAMMEKLVKKSSGLTNKDRLPNSWVVFVYADWSDSCVELEPMLADISLRFVKSLAVDSAQGVREQLNDATFCMILECYGVDIRPVRCNLVGSM